MPTSSLQSLMFHEVEFSELNMKVDLWTPWFKNNIKTNIHLTSKTKGCQSGLSRVSRFSGSIIQQLDSEILLLNKES